MKTVNAKSVIFYSHRETWVRLQAVKLLMHPTHPHNVSPSYKKQKQLLKNQVKYPRLSSEIGQVKLHCYRTEVGRP